MLHLHLDLAVGRIGAEAERLGLRDVWDGKGVANEEVAYVGEIVQVLNLHWKGRDVLLVGVDDDCPRHVRMTAGCSFRATPTLCKGITGRSRTIRIVGHRVYSLHPTTFLPNEEFVDANQGITVHV